MATVIEVKKALRDNSNFRERVVGDGVLKLVEDIKSKDPNPRDQDSKKAESFFQKRAQKAQQYASGGIPSTEEENISWGSASNFIDGYIKQAGVENPWEAEGDAAAVAATLEPAIDDSTLRGMVELSFNGLAGIDRAEMEVVTALSFWTHPFGLPEL